MSSSQHSGDHSGSVTCGTMSALIEISLAPEPARSLQHSAGIGLIATDSPAFVSKNSHLSASFWGIPQSKLAACCESGSDTLPTGPDDPREDGLIRKSLQPSQRQNKE